MRRLAWLMILVFPYLADCQFLKQPCLSNADCSPPHSWCQRNDRFSAKGQCDCLPGYLPIGIQACYKNVSDFHENKFKAAPVQSSASSVLGKPCSKMADCTSGDPNAFCQQTPPVCKVPTAFCACQRGYVADQGKCRRSASIGQACGDGIKCVDERTFCNQTTKTCTCDPSSKPDPKKQGVCVAKVAFGDYGDECSMTNDCLHGFVCEFNQCLCRLGYRFDEDLELCVLNDLGDDCESDDDCFGVKYARCSLDSATCGCLPNFNITVVSLSGTVKTVCLAQPTTSRRLGETCVDDDEGFERNFCRPPFVCSACSADGSSSVCAMPAIMTVPTTAPPPTTTRRVSTLSVRRAAALLDDECSWDGDCWGVANSYCDVNTTFTCQCKRGFIREDDETCTGGEEPLSTTLKPRRIQLGDECDSDGDCRSLPNATCDYYANIPVCDCQPGFVRNGNTSCSPGSIATTPAGVNLTTVAVVFEILLGDSCDIDSDCSQSINNSYCNDDYECACEDGLMANQNGTACVVDRRPTTPPPLCNNSLCDFGALCRPGWDNCRSPGAVCFQNRCQCPPGTKMGLKQDCIENRRRARFNQSCEDSSDCLYDLTCLTYKCKCSAGYKAVGDFDCAKRQLGDTCLYDRDCQFIKNSRCIKQHCSCDANFAIRSETECIETLWMQNVNAGVVDAKVPCEGDADCVGPGVPNNAICGLEGYCRCSKNAYVDEDGRCKYQASTDHTGWACTYTKDCLGADYICVNDKCRKKYPVMASGSENCSTNVVTLLALLLLLTISCS